MTNDELARAFLEDRDIACPACSYNLRGAGGSICPECGTAFEIQLVPAAAGMNIRLHDPELERLRLVDLLRSRDIPCPSCNANLRGHDTLNCPECSQALSAWMLRPRGLIGVEDGRRVARGPLFMLTLMGLIWVLVIILLLFP